MRAGNHRIRLIVITEALKDRIPIELPVQFHGNVLQQASRAGTMGNFGRRYILRPLSHTFQPVAMMVRTHIQPDGIIIRSVEVLRNG